MRLHILVILSITLLPIFVHSSGANSPPLSIETYRDSTTRMEFVFVQGGCYHMGDNFNDEYVDELPLHEICLDDFYIGKYEVTQGEYKKVTGSNPSSFKKGDKSPVERISWPDTQIFIQKLNRLSSQNYRLPTEAEWEYAARSRGKKERYPGGHPVDSVAWYDGNSDDTTHKVGTKLPNGLGIHDMSGNVTEWCQDWFDMNYYKSSPRDNPKGSSLTGGRRIHRGGSWIFKAINVRASYRGGCEADEDHRRAHHGFRLVLPAQK